MGAFSGTDKQRFGYPTPGPQTPTGQKVMDHVFFMSEAEWKAAREYDHFDFVVIGTGFCGLAFVKRALELNPTARILMLERGTFFLPEHFQNLPTPYVQTLGGLSETFPWTLSTRTASGEFEGTLRWQHGMVPFFGGRSTLWSAWCPRPTDDEMMGWPPEAKSAVLGHLDDAERVLHVQSADSIDASHSADVLECVRKQRPVYGLLQSRVQSLLESAPHAVNGVYRAEPASLASDSSSLYGIDFEKFATPSELLEIETRQRRLAYNGNGSALKIATNCVVEQLLQQDGVVTALETSRGTLPLSSAKLVLAMGTLPATTLVQNSFPESRAGERFSAHFITAVVARIPRSDLDPNNEFSGLEIGACYVAGTAGSFDKQYHLQISCLSDSDPDSNAETALKYMPDVVATASQEQLRTSRDHIVFVCAVLGELDYRNEDNWFRFNQYDNNPTTNSILQFGENSNDFETWGAMDKATFDIIEQVLSPKGASSVEYWHGHPDDGEWRSDQPDVGARRINALVHESSTLHVGAEEDAPVDVDYRLKAANNVYVTGGGLWPQGGSWNPTLAMVAMALDLAEKVAD